MAESALCSPCYLADPPSRKHPVGGKEWPMGDCFGEREKIWMCGVSTWPSMGPIMVRDEMEFGRKRDKSAQLSMKV
jgi:hypothetical protein